MVQVVRKCKIEFFYYMQNKFDGLEKQIFNQIIIEFCRRLIGLTKLFNELNGTSKTMTEVNRSTGFVGKFVFSVTNLFNINLFVLID